MKINYCNIWEYQDDKTIKGIDNWIVPAMEYLPDFYKKLKPGKESPNVRTCPSYLLKFKNSMVYKLPRDLRLTFEDVEEHGEPMVFMGEDHEMFDIIKCESHTAFLGDDLLGDFSDQFHNVKIDSNLIIKSAKGRIEPLFMDVFDYSPISKFRTATGPLPILDNKEVCLNVNIWVPRMFKEVVIPAGTAIALLYFPMGIPEFEYNKIEITEREKPVGEYLGKMSKCPYNHG